MMNRFIKKIGTNYTDENLTCYNQSTLDADEDSVVNIYNWYKNNQPLAVLNIPFESFLSIILLADISTKKYISLFYS